MYAESVFTGPAARTDAFEPGSSFGASRMAAFIRSFAVLLLLYAADHHYALRVTAPERLAAASCPELHANAGGAPSAPRLPPHNVDRS